MPKKEMSPELIEGYRRQMALVAEADRNDPELEAFLDAALLDLFELMDEEERQAEAARISKDAK